MDSQAQDTVFSSFATSFASGSIAGIVAKMITLPVERVRLNEAIGAKEPIRGLISTVSRIAKEKGPGFFWKGSLSSSIRYFPPQGMNLASKDLFHFLLPNYDPRTQFGSFLGVNLAAGGAAGAFSSLFVYPWDFVWTRFTSDRQFSTLQDCAIKTANGPPKGIMNFYQFFGISIAGIITYRGIQFGLNDTLKGVNPWDKETSLAGLASKWTIAQFSTYLATIFTNPFDIARRSLSLEVEGRKQVHTGVTDSLKKIVQRDGILSLFKGTIMMTLQRTGSVIVLVVYGELQNLWNK